MPQPWYTHPSACRNALNAFAHVYDIAHNLVAENQRKLGLGEFIVHDMQIGSAHPAGQYPDKHLPRRRPGHGQLPLHQGFALLLQDHGFHG
jgi:hypothetical protein